MHRLRSLRTRPIACRPLAPLPLLRNPDPDFVAGRACGADPSIAADWQWNQFSPQKEKAPNPPEGELEALRAEVRNLRTKIKHFRWALNELLSERDPDDLPDLGE